MRCGDDEELDLPPAVIEMLARYRRGGRRPGFGRGGGGFGWDEESLPDPFRWARFALLGSAFDEFAASGNWAGAVRAVVGDDVPPGLVLVAVEADGGLSAQSRPRPGVGAARDRRPAGRGGL